VRPVLGRGLVTYDLDRLRAALTLDDVLTATGHDAPQRSFFRCLKHAENTASCKAYPDGHFHCFSCEWHGDVFTLVMELHHCDFRDAVRHVARLAGVDPDAEPSPADMDAARQRREATVRRADVTRDMVATADALRQCDDDARWVGQTLHNRDNVRMWDALQRIYTRRDSLDAYHAAVQDEWKPPRWPQGDKDGEGWSG